MADGSAGDFWGGRDDGGRSKGQLLADLRAFGALLIGREGAAEVPYWGASFHAEELEREGLARRYEHQPVAGATIWRRVAG